MKRPLYRPDVTWFTDGAKAVPPLDRGTLDRIRQHAATISSVYATHAGTVDNMHELVNTVLDGGYAAGIADVLAWLTGDDPSPELSRILADITDTDRTEH